MGPAIPVGNAACPMFIAELYSGNGTSGSAEFRASTVSVNGTSGCLWPYHFVAESNGPGSTGLNASEFVVVRVTTSPPVAPPCVPSGSVSVNNTTYDSCTAALDWAGTGTASQPLVRTTFNGVRFQVSGYNTADCSVVNVTGEESSGAAYSLLIYPAPFNCTFDQPTALFPDGAFGATWSGGATIQLLVKASS